VIALGFMSHVLQGGELYQLFALTVLPPPFFLGLFTFVRLVEDILCGAGNRICHNYLELADRDARYFLLSGHDALGAIRNIGPAVAALPRPCDRGQGSQRGARRQRDRILVGVTLDLPLAVAAIAGIALLAVSVGLHVRYDRRAHERAEGITEDLFPSPTPRSR
jgi:hypothetical protein